MPDDRWRDGALAAEFDDENAILAAAKTLHARGYDAVEAYTPYPVPELDRIFPASRSWLPEIVFVSGVTGAILGYGIQWFANVVSYPLNIGGRPVHSVPAFFIPTFEATVLCAALGAFLGLFAVLRLPQPWHPVFEVDGFERATIDRFWLAIGTTDTRASPAETMQELRALNPRRVVQIPGAPA